MVTNTNHDSLVVALKTCLVFWLRFAAARERPAFTCSVMGNPLSRAVQWFDKTEEVYVSFNGRGIGHVSLVYGLFPGKVERELYLEDYELWMFLRILSEFRTEVSPDQVERLWTQARELCRVIKPDVWADLEQADLAGLLIKAMAIPVIFGNKLEVPCAV